MRVLMFGWEFPPHIAGGLGTACYGMTKGLAANDVDVLFVMPKASGDEDESAVKIINASDVPITMVEEATTEFVNRVQFLQVSSDMIPYADPEVFKNIVSEEHRHQQKEFRVQYGQRYSFSGKYGANLLDEVARYGLVGGAIAQDHEGEFDIIHAHDWLTYLAGIAAKEVSGKPLVVHVHATSFDRSSEDKIDTRVFALEKRGMEAADCVMAVSELTRNIVINKYGIDPSKVVTVHNAVDFSGREEIHVERGVEDKVVTFLGRVTFQKGPEYFIEAAAKVLKRLDNVRFVMAGSGDMLNRCIRRVAKLGISDRFHFTGFLRGREVSEMFALSDVYVMPSISEPFGISPLEAMQIQVPTIISKQSGCAEILKYAIKTDFWDIDAMADAMYSILTNPALAEFSAKRGYEEVNSIKWVDVATKMKGIYQDTINKCK